MWPEVRSIYWSGTGQELFYRRRSRGKKVIEETRVREHAIFIDDARCFDGREDRPDIVDVLARLRAIHPGYRIRILNDIVIATLVASS